MLAGKFYKKHNHLFRYYDYNFERYKVKFSVALIKLDDKVIPLDIDFDSVIRYSDKHLNVNDKYHFFLFLGADIKAAFQALLHLEKNIISKHNLYYIDTIFQGAVVSKVRDRDIEEMIRLCFELIDECKENQNIITEDDI